MMYAISSDNDNQDNNYTKLSSSITVTYHLNNQALNGKRSGEERKDPGLGFSVPYVSGSKSSLGRSCAHGVKGVDGVICGSIY